MTAEVGCVGWLCFLPVSCCVHTCTTSNAFHQAALLWKASWRGWRVLEEEWRTGPVGREPQQWSSRISWAAIQGANSSRFKGKLMCQKYLMLWSKLISAQFKGLHLLWNTAGMFWVSLCKSNEPAVETPEGACRPVNPPRCTGAPAERGQSAWWLLGTSQ